MNFVKIDIGRRIDDVFQPAQTFSEAGVLDLFSRYAAYQLLDAESEQLKDELLMRALDAGGVIRAETIEGAVHAFRVKSNRWGTVYMQNWPEENSSPQDVTEWWDVLRLPSQRQPLNLLCPAPTHGAERHDIRYRKRSLHSQGRTLLGLIRATMQKPRASCSVEYRELHSTRNLSPGP